MDSVAQYVATLKEEHKGRHIKHTPLKIDNLNQLRKILVLDPQMIYRDAKVGDVYRVTDYSLVSELYIKYVYVYES